MQQQLSSQDQQEMLEFTADIVEALKAGLHPKDLTKEERKCMKIHYGKEWYRKFGYRPKEN